MRVKSLAAEEIERSLQRWGPSTRAQLRARLGLRLSTFDHAMAMLTRSGRVCKQDGVYRAPK